MRPPGKPSNVRKPVIKQISKMRNEIPYNRPLYLHRDIMPWHSWSFMSIEYIPFIVLYIIHISNSDIIIINPIPYMRLVHIRKLVLIIIKSSIAEIKTSHEANAIVNTHKFFMMSPGELSPHYADMWVADYSDISVASFCKLFVDIMRIVGMGQS